MRVFVPATFRTLLTLRDKGLTAPVQAHAVTGGLREWYVEGDAEELEYAASSQAATASLRLLAEEDGTPRRRVVVAADVPDGDVRPLPGHPLDGPRSEVELTRDLHLTQVVSVHVDDDEARADVDAAVQALAAAAAGDQDAQFVVEGAEGHELLWYDVTELDDVLS